MLSRLHAKTISLTHYHADPLEPTTNYNQILGLMESQLRINLSFCRIIPNW